VALDMGKSRPRYVDRLSSRRRGLFNVSLPAGSVMDDQLIYFHTVGLYWCDLWMFQSASDEFERSLMGDVRESDVGECMHSRSFLTNTSMSTSIHAFSVASGEELW